MKINNNFPVPVVDATRTGVFGMVGAAIRTAIARLLFDIFGAPILMLVVYLYRALLLLVVFEAGSFLVGGFFYDGPWRGWSPVASFENGIYANVVVLGSAVIAVRDMAACLVVGTHCGPSGPDPKPIFAKSPSSPSPAERQRQAAQLEQIAAGQRQRELHLAREKHKSVMSGEVLQEFLPVSGVNFEDSSQKWPKIEDSTQSCLQQSVDSRRCGLSSPAVLAFELDGGSSLSMLR